MSLRSTADLVDEEWHEIKLPRPFSDLLGSPPPGFSATVHGHEGCGKSTFSLGLAYALLPHAIVQGGSVVYNANEEGHGSEISDKAARLGAAHEALHISDAQTVSELKDEIEEADAKWVFVDSGSRLDPTSQQLLDLLSWGKHNEVGVVFVLRQTKEGKYRGDSGLVYDPGVEIECFKEGGEERAITRKNRHAPANREIKIPMQPGEIGTPASFETARRQNPNCENWSEKDPATQRRCKAMFASLQESGAYDPKELDGTTIGEEETPQGSASDDSENKTTDKSEGGEEGGEDLTEEEREEAMQTLNSIKETLEQFI